MFTVTGFEPGDTCDASEGAAPAGYSKAEAWLPGARAAGGWDAVLHDHEHVERATVTVHKDFSDDNEDAVSVSLTCSGDGDVDSSPKDATDEDNVCGAPAVFTVTGFGLVIRVMRLRVRRRLVTRRMSLVARGSMLQAEGTPSCTITNTLKSATVTVHKDFSDDNEDAVERVVDVHG